MVDVEGLTRYRAHNFGRQSAMNTPVAAVGRYPFKGVPDVNPNWTDDDIDVGSLDTVAAPWPAAPDLTAPLTCPSLRYNMIPLLMCGVFGGGVDDEAEGSAGTGKKWTHTPASLTVDDVDVFTYEHGDDDLDDWFQLSDGIIETLEISGPEGLGPLTVSSSWRFGHVGNTGSTDFPVTGTVPTPDLELDPDAARVFLKDMGIYIASSIAGLSGGQILNKLHSFTWRVTGNVDQKRWANADQSFDIDAYSRATRMIELVLTFAKGDDITGTGSESDAWLSKTAVGRYIRFAATSEEIADLNGADPDIPYSWQVTSPMRYYTRETTDSGGNSVVVLTACAYFDGADGDLGAVCESVAVTTLATADL